jgi:hypothetical protein
MAGVKRTGGLMDFIGDSLLDQSTGKSIYFIEFNKEGNTSGLLPQGAPFSLSRYRN